MSAKYPLKVKLELLTTLEYQSWGELCVPVFWGSLGFYSSVEPNFYACATSLFLIGKIFINVHILPNPPRIRILFILGFYGLGLFMRHKLFPFRISWRPHNDQFSAMWPFDSSTLVRSHQFRLLLARLFGSIISKFLPLQLPPHPMGPWSMSGRTHGVTVQSDLLRNTLTLTGWPKIINDEEHTSLTKWSLTWVEAPFHLSCHSLYINQTFLLSFLYFLLKYMIKAHPASLSDHTIQLLHPSSTPFYHPTSTW